MAGNYPDPPGNRIPYDIDGTAVFQNAVELSSGAKINLNDESNSYYDPYDGTQNPTLSWFFPRAMTITGLRASGAPWIYGTQGTWYVSSDATNYLDGTWTSLGLNVGYYNAVGMANLYRTVASTFQTNVRALRLNIEGTAGTTYVYGAHIYGHVQAGENADRLEIWHPTLDQRVGGAYFDWGNVPRSSTADKTFRIKNLSSTLTANSISLSFASLTDTTPSVPSMHYVSSDGINFFGSMSAGSLGPGAVSSIFTMRRVVPSDAVLTLWAARMRAVAASWSV